MLAPGGEELYIAQLQRGPVISTAATQIGHRHICRLRRTKKSRSHSETVDVHTGPVGLCLRQARRGGCAMQSPTQNNCMDGHQVSPELNLWWTKSQSEWLESRSVHIESTQQDKQARFSNNDLFKTCCCRWHDLSSMPVMSDGAKPDKCI